MKEKKMMGKVKRLLSLLLAVALIAGCTIVPAEQVQAAGRKGWYKTAYGNWYFYKNGKKQKGWLTDKNQRYYLNSAGTMVKGLQKINGRYYYFSPRKTSKYSEGARVTGWVKLKNKWYYFKTAGTDKGMMTRNQWLAYNRQWYFLQKNGVMKAGAWQSWKGERYYLTSDGSMRIGWLKYNNKYYYLTSPSGKMARSTTLTIGGRLYKFNASGVYYQ